MKAILVSNDDGYTAKLSEVEESRLPDGDVLVRVDHSTLNYKDALAITGKSPVVRNFPMIPGIDLVGEVLASTNAKFAPGDEVLLNGYGVGEAHWGGLAQKARLKSDWLIKLPDGFTSREAMAIGTAGYTAMLCVMALENHGVTPDKGEILVSGAAGGVGSIAVCVLSKLGYKVTASTGRVQQQGDYLKALGASNLIERSDLSEQGRPLQKERWAGAIDVAGSHTLANICASIKYGGAVAACGLAQGMDLPSSVLPFILRGVTLCGIDSVYAGKDKRLEAWSRLARDLPKEKLHTMITELKLDDVIEAAPKLLNGQIHGRIVVNVQG